MEMLQKMGTPPTRHKIKNIYIYIYVCKCICIVMCMPAGGKPVKHAFLGGVGPGGGMLTFVRTCHTSACYVTSWVGWGGGMLTFVRTCDTSACYVTSGVGPGGGC